MQKIVLYDESMILISFFWFWMFLPAVLAAIPLFFLIKLIRHRVTGYSIFLVTAMIALAHLLLTFLVICFIALLTSGDLNNGVSSVLAMAGLQIGTSTVISLVYAFKLYPSPELKAHKLILILFPILGAFGNSELTKARLKWGDVSACDKNDAACIAKIAVITKNPELCAEFSSRYVPVENRCIGLMVNSGKLQYDDCLKMWAMNDDIAILSRKCFSNVGKDYPETASCRSAFKRSDVEKFRALQCWSKSNVNSRFPASGDTPLIAFVKGNEPLGADLLRSFTDLGADINLKDRAGRTALFYASFRQVSDLLDAGANAGVTDNAGQSAPMYWVSRNNETGYTERSPYLMLTGEQVGKLVKKGFAPNYADSDGNTILHLLAKKEWRTSEEQSFILTAMYSIEQIGGDRSIANRDSMTPDQILKAAK